MRLIDDSGENKQASIYRLDCVWWVADRVEAHEHVMVGWHLCHERLRPPHFPEVYSFGIYGGHAFVEMEYVEGVPPTTWSQPDAEAILSQLREANIWHRDIRLCNLLQRPTGEWCLLDFGWACDYDDPYPAPWYLGAEGRKGHGEWDDEYAMGVIKEMLGG